MNEITSIKRIDMTTTNDQLADEIGARFDTAKGLLDRARKQLLLINTAKGADAAKEAGVSFADISEAQAGLNSFIAAISTAIAVGHTAHKELNDITQNDNGVTTRSGRQ